MKIINHALIVALFTLFAFTSQAASIKKWTDENGRVFYGDAPPPSAHVEVVKTHKRPTNLGKPLPRLSIPDSTKKTAPSKTSSNELEPQQAKEACNIAKKDKQVIQKSTRIQLRAADGSLRYMTKEEISQRLERSKSDIKRFCK